MHRWNATSLTGSVVATGGGGYDGRESLVPQSPREKRHDTSRLRAPPFRHTRARRAGAEAATRPRDEPRGNPAAEGGHRPAWLERVPREDALAGVLPGRDATS